MNLDSLEHAEWLVSQRAYSQALRLIDIRTASPEEKTVAAKALIGLGEIGQALEIVQELCPGNDKLLFQCLLRLKRFDEAAPVLDRLAGEHFYPSLHLQFLGLSGDDARMLEMLERYTAEASSLEACGLCVSVAMVYAAREDYDLAFQYYSQSEQYGESTAADLHSIAWFHHRNGRYEQARKYLDASLELQPTSYSALRFRYLLAKKTKDLDSGLSALAALQANRFDELSSICFDRARLYLACDHIREAAQELVWVISERGHWRNQFAATLILVMTGHWRYLGRAIRSRTRG